MGNAFDVAMAAIFRDGNMATVAVHQVGGFGPETSVRVLRRSGDVQQGWAGAQIVSDGQMIEVQVGDLAVLAEGDTFRIGGALYRVQGEPQRDEDRRIWRADVIAQ